jgi:hypothetical protein
MTFSIQHVLRQLSAELLKDYLDHKGLNAFRDIQRLPRTQHASAVTARIVETDDHISQSISADLARVHPLSTERGRYALLNASPGGLAFAERFALLQNDFERALWVLLTSPEIFGRAEELHFFDYYAEGNRGQHYRTQSHLSVHTDADAVNDFRDTICGFYRRRDGSGVSCLVESNRRNREQSLQITIFVQGLPNSATEFVNGKFRRTISHPALEAAIVYESETGNVTTVAKGGKDVHEALRDAFAKHLLKMDPQFDRIEKRRFRLDALRSGRVLPADADLGVQSARVRKLKLAPPNFGGHLVVEAPGANSAVAVFDLGNQWFVEKSALFEKFSVLHATISMRLQPRPNQRRCRTINLELTMPNGSNPKSLNEADRTVAEAHIEKWNLIEPVRM